MSEPVFPKAYFMGMVVAGIAHESFHHSIDGIFDVTECRKLCREQNRPTQYVALDDILMFIKSSRDYEQARVVELAAIMLEKSPRGFELRADPALAIVTPQGEHIWIDGTHRALARAALGYADIPCWFLPIKEAIRPDPEVYGQVKAQWGDPNYMDNLPRLGENP